MLYEKAEQLAQNRSSIDLVDLVNAGEDYLPSLGAFVSAQAGRAFDMSSGVRFSESLERQNLIEGRKYSSSLGGLSLEPDTKYEVTPLTEEEYKASPYYREGIEYQPGATEGWAKLTSENFDERRVRDNIIEQRTKNGGVFDTVVGFAAGMAGSIPDPINFIPFGGGIARGAKIAEASLAQLAKQAVPRGIAEGVLGNVAVSGYAAYELNPLGEDITAQDILYDAALGAVLGPAFHMGGALAARGGARRSIRMGTPLEPKIFTPEDIQAEANRIGEGDPVRTKTVAEVLNLKQAESLGALNHRDAIRQGLSQADRVELVNSIRTISEALKNGDKIDYSQSVEVSPQLKEKIESLSDDYKSQVYEDPILKEVVGSFNDTTLVDEIGRSVGAVLGINEPKHVKPAQSVRNVTDAIKQSVADGSLTMANLRQAQVDLARVINKLDQSANPDLQVWSEHARSVVGRIEDLRTEVKSRFREAYGVDAPGVKKVEILTEKTLETPIEKVQVSPEKAELYAVKDKEIFGEKKGKKEGTLDDGKVSLSELASPLSKEENVAAREAFFEDLFPVEKEDLSSVLLKNDTLSKESKDLLTSGVDEFNKAKAESEDALAILECMIDAVG